MQVCMNSVNTTLKAQYRLESAAPMALRTRGDRQSTVEPRHPQVSCRRRADLRINSAAFSRLVCPTSQLYNLL
jgi:hypothetical protein